MLQPNLTEQQRMVFETVRKFARQEVAAQADRVDREHFFNIERFMGDAKNTQIVEVTNQIQRMIIGRVLLRGKTPSGGVMTWKIEPS